MPHVDSPLAVHLARTGDAVLDTSIEGYEVLARRSKVGHVLVTEPRDADLLILTQAHLCPDPLTLVALRQSEAWRDHRARTFVIDFRDRPWCAFPGLYTSMPSRHFRSRWQRAWSYPWINEESFLPLRKASAEVLFSFVGGRTHPCRSAVLELDTPLGIVEDTTGFDYLDASAAAAPSREHFRHVLGQSRFVLCPRGHGTSSFRLQEVLAAGRVPVIISDDWQPPLGPDWGSCCIRWPEGRIGEIPNALLRLEPEFPRMSSAARALYDTWFASASMFDRMIEQVTSIGSVSSFPRQGVHGAWYARQVLGAVRARTLGRAGS